MPYDKKILKPKKRRGMWVLYYNAMADLLDTSVPDLTKRLEILRRVHFMLDIQHAYGYAWISRHALEVIYEIAEERGYPIN
jgi:hypothetical protein